VLIVDEQQFFGTPNALLIPEAETSTRFSADGAVGRSGRPRHRPGIVLRSVGCVASPMPNIPVLGIFASVAS
jgi:hypothetical protein